MNAQDLRRKLAAVDADVMEAYRRVTNLTYSLCFLRHNFVCRNIQLAISTVYRMVRLIVWYLETYCNTDYNLDNY